MASDQGYVWPDQQDLATEAMIRQLSDSAEWEAEEELVFQRLLAEMALLEKPTTMLDLGAGTGRVTSRLAASVDSADLVEPDERRRNTAIAIAAARPTG